MPPKPRDFYTTEYTGRDFGWFSPSGSSATRTPRNHRTGPKSRSSSVARSITHKAPSRKSSTMFGVSKRPRRAKMASIVEESPDVYMTPAVVTVAPTEQPPPEPEAKKPGPWSEWYETRNQSRFWRARKLPDDTWSYQFSETNPAAISKPPRPKPPPGSNRSLASFFFGIPMAPPTASPASHVRTASVFPPPPRDNDLEPDRDPESASTNSSSISTPSHDRLKIPLARSSGTTFPSSVSTGKGKGSSLSILSSERISTLSRHEENSSRGRGAHHRGKPALSSKAGPKSKANAPLIANASAGPNPGVKPPRGTLTGGGASKPRGGAAATTIISLSLSKPRAKANAIPPVTLAAVSGNVNVKENTKKLDKKVKNEKELRIDTKKRVKTWLKDVVPEVVQSEWDDQGLPVYK